MAVKEYSLRAHDDGALLLRNLYRFAGSFVEGIRHHVIRIIAKRLVAQTDIGGVLELFTSPATQVLFPQILNSYRRQRLRHVLTVKMRQPARHWESANINQARHGVAAKNS